MPHKRTRHEMIPTERIGMVVLLLAENREQRYTTAYVCMVGRD